MRWTSFWDGHSRRTLRFALVLMCFVEFAAHATRVSRMANDAVHYHPGGAISDALFGSGWLALVLFVPVALGLLLVASDRAPIRGGLLALAGFCLISNGSTELFGSPSRGSFYPGAALLGWSLGQLWAREAGQPDVRARERLGEVGTIAGIAAAYVGSATSKLRVGGLGWASPGRVRSLVLAQEPLADWPWLEAYRDTIITDDTLAQIASSLTLVIEGGAFFLLFGARARLLWALLILALHTNIILLCAMPYVEPMWTVFVFALPWPVVLRWKPEVAAEPAITPGIPRRVRYALAGLFAFAIAASPFGWDA